MLIIKNDFISSILIITFLSFVFHISNVINKKFNTEVSRKFVHISSGLFSLTFPFIISNHFSLLILSILFSLLIFVMKYKTDNLKSVTNIDRKSIGEVLFPISIYLLFVFSEKYYLYFISVLVLSISDALAALIGKKYGMINIKVENDQKTLEGTITFFLITFIIVEIPLLVMTDIDKIACLLIALMIAVLITMLELISIYGMDNMLVPIGTLFILHRTTQTDTQFIANLIIMLIFVITVITFLFKQMKVVTFSGIVGIIIVNYISLVLCSIEYFLVLLVFQLIFWWKTLNFNIIEKYNISEIIQTNFWNILVSFYVHFNYHLLNTIFPIFISIICWQSLLIFDYLEEKDTKNNTKNSFQKLIKNILFVGITSVPIFIFFKLQDKIAIFLITTVLIYFLNLVFKLGISEYIKYRFMIRNVIILCGIIIQAYLLL
ncbi:MAG: hypothetical protein N2169_04140 [bacterium]|nr:hypothetical protein [bacterium]